MQLNTQSPNNLKNILIIEAYTDANIGSCALVENALKIINRKFPNTKVQVMAQYPEAFTSLYGVDAVEDIFMLPAKQHISKKLLWLMQSIWWMLIVMLCILFSPCRSINNGLRFPFRNRILPFLWADCVISIGAERLNDKYYKNIPFSLFTFLLAKLLGKKVIIFPATFGPFFFRWSKLLSGKVLSLIDLNYTRDSESTRTLIQDLHVPPSKIISSVDVAVLQQPINRMKSYELIPADPDELIVGISILRWSYYKNRIETPYSNYTAYVREIAKTANYLISNYGVLIVFYPTNFKTNACEDDDMAVVFDIMPLIKKKDCIKIIHNLPTPSQFQGMLSCSTINITTRMHACILSTNAFVPTISINYLPKLKGYMESLGMAEFSIDIEEFSAEKVITAFNAIWPDRHKWETHLKSVMQTRTEHLWKTMDQLDAVI